LLMLRKRIDRQIILDLREGEKGEEKGGEK
jgi:hypothetical protein